jgi:hypothetical protein
MYLFPPLEQELYARIDFAQAGCNHRRSAPEGPNSGLAKGYW